MIRKKGKFITPKCKQSDTLSSSRPKSWHSNTSTTVSENNTALETNSDTFFSDESICNTVKTAVALRMTQNEMEEDISSSNHDNDGSVAPPAGQVDIAQFVTQVESFNCMIEPFAFVLYLWDDLRRWRYPVLTVILWLIFNLGCAILTQAAVFTLVSLLVIVIALMCLVQLHTRLLDKFLPGTVHPDPIQDDNIDEHSAIQTVRDFKYSLMQMHEFVCKCNEYLRYFYALLKWDHTLPSLRFHIEVCFLLLCLVVFPSRWTAFLLTNWFFLATSHVYCGARYRSRLLMEYVQGKRTLSSVLEKQKETKASKNCVNGGITGETDSDDTLPLTDADKLCDTGQDDFEDDMEGQMMSSDNQPGMVARLMEFKRRRKLISSESCFECKASFSSILKRRYNCCHCGNNFCSKCCNQKVPKSMMGATAPSAQTETVLVCVVCYKLLQDEQNMTETGKEKSS